ncbi:hypothetical protein [[Phormidium] sp. LEGE 05292]|uniref:hypothetical protein n=1 Tax=[Phormidium] sp. LEGE 05292 TaxID=767427 RepID=UPI0018825970|nr:hypothetical protein [Phormidium sp. LEGE 05292]
MIHNGFLAGISRLGSWECGDQITINQKDVELPCLAVTNLNYLAFSHVEKGNFLIVFLVCITLA